MPGAPPPPPPGSLHRSSRTLTIALVVVGVVAVGALGALAAVVFGGGDDEAAAPPSLSSTAEPEGGDGILDPEPIGTAEPLPEPAPSEPAPTEPAEPPTVEPTEAPPTQEPPPDSGGGPDLPGNGEVVEVGPGVPVLVPVGWQVTSQGEEDISFGSGDGSFGYVLTGVGDPAFEASAVITQNLSAVLPTENYSQLTTGDVRPLEPFGSLVSVAVMDFSALWVDAQSTFPLGGQVYAAVRSDGVIVLMVLEHTPPEDYEAAAPGGWGDLLDGTLVLLGGS